MYVPRCLIQKWIGFFFDVDQLKRITYEDTVDHVVTSASNTSYSGTSDTHEL